MLLLILAHEEVMAIVPLSDQRLGGVSFVGVHASVLNDIDVDALKLLLKQWRKELAGHNPAPLYERQKKPGYIEAVDFRPFLQKALKSIAYLKHMLKQMESKSRLFIASEDNVLLRDFYEMQAKTAGQLALIQKRYDLYQDKVAYTLQYSERPPKKICMLLHGLSNRPHDIAKYAPMVEDVLYVIPQGFEPFYMIWPIVKQNFQWFSVGNFWNAPHKETIKSGLERVQPIFVQWLDDLTELPEITHDDLVVCGASQGAITALAAIKSHPKVRHGIAVSGAVDPQDLEEARVMGNNILMIYASNDHVVPSALSQCSAAGLRRAGACVEEVCFESPGEDHSECHRIFKHGCVQDKMERFLMAIVDDKR